MYSLSRLCFTLGDVMSSVAQAYLPQYVVKSPSGGLEFNLKDAKPLIRKLLAMAFGVACVSNTIAFSTLRLFPHWFTTDKAVAALMGRVVPWVAAGLAMHSTIVAMEGVLLAKKDIRWLMSMYAAGGVLTLAGTWSLAAGAASGRIGLSAVWAMLTAYQFYRFVAFLWRVFIPSRASRTSSRYT